MLKIRNSSLHSCVVYQAFSKLNVVLCIVFGRLTIPEYTGLKVKCFILKVIRNVITMFSKEVLNINDVSNES